MKDREFIENIVELKLLQESMVRDESHIVYLKHLIWLFFGFIIGIIVASQVLA